MEHLMAVIAKNGDREAIIWKGRSYSYQWLAARTMDWDERLDRDGVKPGAVVSLGGDFSPSGVALFLTLARRSCVIVPLPADGNPADAEFQEVAEVEYSYLTNDDGEGSSGPNGRKATNDLYAGLRAKGHPGLILFSSGSAGLRKAALHDLEMLLEKFWVKRRQLRAVTLLLFDHIGGINTMLYTLSNGGCLVIPGDRSPERVLQAVSAHHVELLPASPSFLNLLILSGALERHDISSLRLVTYGTEPMPMTTLQRLHALMPEVDLLQTYGLSEVGILRSKSRASDSLWLRIGGEGFETRVVDGVLHIRARSAMLGYLNAPSPFTEDGWLNTGDLVETDGEFIRFVGRAAEVINVGGKKVHPTLVENVIQEVEGVAQATAYGEANALLGKIVCAKIRPLDSADRADLIRRVKDHCRARLAAHEVPMRVVVEDEPQHGRRYKKLRPGGAR